VLSTAVILMDDSYVPVDINAGSVEKCCGIVMVG
jgi:hypothetical protein